ncbi:MAG TPA: phosphoribosylamine--glycine ligase, partial [Ruminococcaceae bacterium]|nr:phosphoribosylamine--glycine ligase [Oscillospiraceae bacterium]
VTVYHAGTARRDGKFYTEGGRVLGVTALGEDLDEALRIAYGGVSKIHFEGAHYRRDIGR